MSTKHISRVCMVNEKVTSQQLKDVVSNCLISPQQLASQEKKTIMSAWTKIQLAFFNLVQKWEDLVSPNMFADPLIDLWLGGWTLSRSGHTWAHPSLTPKVSVRAPCWGPWYSWSASWMCHLSWRLWWKVWRPRDLQHRLHRWLNKCYCKTEDEEQMEFDIKTCLAEHQSDFHSHKVHTKSFTHQKYFISVAQE